MAGFLLLRDVEETRCPTVVSVHNFKWAPRLSRETNHRPRCDYFFDEKPLSAGIYDMMQLVTLSLLKYRFRAHFVGTALSVRKKCCEMPHPALIVTDTVLAASGMYLGIFIQELMNMLALSTNIL